MLTLVSDGFNAVHICMEEKGVVFLRGKRYANGTRMN